MNTPVRLGALALLAAGLAACGTTTPPAAVTAKPAAAAAPAPATATAAPAAAAATATAKEFFVVLPESGRIHAFGDTKNYFDYQAHGEVLLTRTRIGEGPGGKTLVYGITGDDVKANKPSVGEQIMTGTLLPASDFYGEVLKDGRFYLFGDLADMKSYVAFGEVPYSYTDIGAGPKGETIVMVMNKDSYKAGRPAVRMERFKALRAAAK